MPDIGQIKGTNIKRGNSGLDPKIFDLNKELLDAMRIIARQEIDRASRDITKNALVRSVNSDGSVNITLEGKEFNKIPNYTVGTVKENDVVKVTYPQNQASNMYVSGCSNDGIKKINYVNFLVKSSNFGSFNNNQQEATLYDIKNNKFVILNLAFTLNTTYSSLTNSTIFTLPNELRPVKNKVLLGFAGRSLGFAFVRNNGNLEYSGSNITANSTECDIVGVYSLD